MADKSTNPVERMGAAYADSADPRRRGMTPAEGGPMAERKRIDFAGLSRAYAESPDPKQRRRLESHARTYQATRQPERDRMERLIEIRHSDPATWAQVDGHTRAALQHYELDKAAYLELHGGKEST